MFSRKTERTKNGNKRSQANIQRKSKKQNSKMLKKNEIQSFHLNPHAGSIECLAIRT